MKTEQCYKCSGTGQDFSGQCDVCEGSGKIAVTPLRYAVDESGNKVWYLLASGLDSILRKRLKAPKEFEGQLQAAYEIGFSAGNKARCQQIRNIIKGNQ